MSFQARTTPLSPAAAGPPSYSHENTAPVASPPHPSSLPSPRHPRYRSSASATVHTTATATATNDIIANSIDNFDNTDSMQLINNHYIAVNHQMEAVTFHLHSRLCNFGLNHTSYRTRNIFEHILLVLAICCACALLMLHRTFVVNTASSQIASTGASFSPAAGTSSSTPVLTREPSTCLDRLEGFDPVSANITHLIILPHNLTIGNLDGGIDIDIESKSMVLWNWGREQGSETREAAASTTTATTTECLVTVEGDGDDTASSTFTSCDANGDKRYHREWLDLQLEAETLPIQYSYSTTKAYLLLPHDHPWMKRDMNVQYVLLSPTDPVCFGEPFVQFLLWKCFVGGNTVLLNWLLTFPAYEDARKKNSSELQETGRSRGYIYNPRTQWLREVGGEANDTATGSNSNSNSNSSNGFFWSSRWNKFLVKVGVFLRVSFLFFFCTTLVSFTLRETQERMLDFTRELSRRVRHSLDVSDLITTHLVQNLLFVPIMLGMMFFLIEFYHGDKLLAFSVASILCSVESFSLICLRSSQGLSYFPYFFFLLFLLFHVYQSAFPDNGFVYLALTVVWCFVFHSMVFFWHRYELPALVLGAVSIHRPRMIPYSGRGGGGAPNVLSAAEAAPLRQQQQHQQPDNRPVRRLHEDRSSTRTSIDGNHLTAPLLTNSAATSPATPADSTLATMAATSSQNSSLLGGAGSSSGYLTSRQSFQSISTSSRRTWGLYQPNTEDDNSTGSHLYFMGGEVVVHQHLRPGSNANHSNASSNTSNHNSNSQNSNSNSNSQSYQISGSGSELSPPTVRRGNSFGNISLSGGVGEGDESSSSSSAMEIGTPPLPLSTFIRNESNFSLLSAASDACGSNHLNNAPSGGGGASINSKSNNTITSADGNSTIDLDVTSLCSVGDRDDDHVDTGMNKSFCESLPNDTSMDTVKISNVLTPQNQQYPQRTKTKSKYNAMTSDDHENTVVSPVPTTTADGYYAQEVGGLQAILETKLTPRHRNSHGSLVATNKQQQNQPYPNPTPLPPSSLSATGTHYQRRPPTFPELILPNQSSGC